MDLLASLEQVALARQLLAKPDRTPAEDQVLNRLLEQLGTLLLLSREELVDTLLSATAPVEELATAGYIDRAQLAYLLAQHREYQKQLAQTLDRAKLPLTQKQTISLLLARKQAQIIQDHLKKTLSDTELKTINQNTSGKPEHDPHRTNYQLAQTIIDNKSADTGITLARPQVAVAALASDIALINPSPQELGALAELAFAQAAPLGYQGQSPVYQLDRRLDPVITAPSAAEYLGFIRDPNAFTQTHLFDPQNLSVTDTRRVLDELASPPTQRLLTQLDPATYQRQIVPDAYKTDVAEAPVFDQLDRVTQDNFLSLDRLLQNSEVIENTLPKLTSLDPTATQELVKQIHLQFPQTRLVPLPEASAFSSFVRNLPDQVEFDPLVLKEFLGRGLRPEQLQQLVDQARTDAHHPLHQVTQDNLRLFTRLINFHRQAASTPAGQQLLDQATQPRLGFVDAFTILQNRLLGRLPAKFIPVAEAIFSPVGFLRSRIGAAIGQRVFTHLAGVVGHEGLKKGLEILALQGFKQGVKHLAAQAAVKVASSLGIHAMAESLNAVIPGLGLIVDAVLTAALFAFDFIKGTIQGAFAYIYGEPLRKRDLLALLGLGAAGGLGLLAGLAGRVRLGLSAATDATIAAAGGAFMTIFFASLIGLILYFAAFNAAPLISTIAQLESGAGALIGLSPGDILPPGQIPASCPTGYPTSATNINRGPNIDSHARNFSVPAGDRIYDSQHQAVDLNAVNAPVRATHDGQAYFYPEFTNPFGFGNFVVIIGQCEGVEFISAYAHLHPHSGPLGGPRSVTRGQVIGTSDNSDSGTGISTGSHLHYEIIGQDKSFDILKWLAR